jgi:hypothetical protein
MAYCPALWSVDVVPASAPALPPLWCWWMMNVRSRKRTSSGAGHLQSALCARLDVIAGGCAVRTSVTPKRCQMRRRRAAQGSDCSPDSHLPGYFSLAGQGGAAPAPKWQRYHRPAFPEAGCDDRDEWRGVQGARVGMGTGRRYSVALCLAQRRIGGASGTGASVV